MTIDDPVDFKKALIARLRRRLVLLTLLSLALLSVVEGPGMFGHDYPYPWRLLKIPGVLLFWLTVWKSRDASSDWRAAKVPN